MVSSDKSVGDKGMEERARDSRNRILEFFNVTDALEVTWAHAVNSQEKLQEALTGEVMMIEADVSLGEDDKTPIMAHPPITYSDLPLTEFLKAVLSSRKGIKLDFKTAAVIEPSLKILKGEVKSREHTSPPIWLNADILLGPCESVLVSCDAVDAHIFLSLCTKFFPSATLSVGWTTGIFPSNDDYYEWPMVHSMRDLLANVTQPVTFAVRAKMVGKSMEQMLWLLSLSDTYTLTIWSGILDYPEIKDLVTLHNKVGDKKRIFYDLPPYQLAKILKELKLQA